MYRPPGRTEVGFELLGKFQIGSSPQFLFGSCQVQTICLNPEANNAGIGEIDLSLVRDVYPNGKGEYDCTLCVVRGPWMRYLMDILWIVCGGAWAVRSIDCHL